MEDLEVQLIELDITFKRTTLAQQWITERTIFAMEASRIQNYLLDRIGNTTIMSLAGKETM